MMMLMMVVSVMPWRRCEDGCSRGEEGEDERELKVHFVL